MAQLGPDIYGVLKGLQRVGAECVKVQEKELRRKWMNSSLQKLTEQRDFPGTSPQELSKNLEKWTKEAVERGSVVLEGLKAIGLTKVPEPPTAFFQVEARVIQTSTFEPETMSMAGISEKMMKLEPVQIVPETVSRVSPQEKHVPPPNPPPPKSPSFTSMPKPKPSASEPKQSLAPNAKARKVPASRIARLVSFGGLFAGLGVGTAAEVTRRALGAKEENLMDNPFLTPANVDRIVATMCKVRGAALKIGQLMSIQDSDVIPPSVQAAFERVRQSADFMPSSQVEKMLKKELGENWREKFKDFEMKPFAAASIGQVHHGNLNDGTAVAVKIQYPGVAEGINSDIENLMSVLNIWNVFPPGAFIDKLVEVAKKELSWEVDYVREAECTRQFRKLLEPYPEYYVPRVIDEVSTSKVFTSELIEGIPVDKCADLDQDTRNHICQLIMHLCLKELFVLRTMQTDPNWSNFFYNTKSDQLILLDFGATRTFGKEFMDKYIQVVKAAADENRAEVLERSKEMGFLTGYESKAMEQAHVDTIMILGEVFSDRVGEFDFGRQNTTKRVTKLVPTILTHRLCPPPEEIYSLHRKLSGVFLLCAKLKVKVACRPLFMDIYNNYVFDT